MKILIFNFEYPPLGGGGGVATQKIAQELSKRHEVHVVTTKPGGQLMMDKRSTDTDRRGKDGMVKIHRVRVWGRKSLETASLLSMLTYVPSAWRKGVQLCGEIDFDVINAQFAVPSGVVAALLSKQTRKPFVLSFIGGDIFDPTKGVSPHRHWVLRFLIRRIASRADVCTAISSDTKKRAIELHKVRNKIVVTHLGIDGSHGPVKSREKLSLPGDVPLFVSIGRVIPRKRYDIILRAIAKTEKAHLAIIGDGPLVANLKQLCKKLKISERVHWLGYISENDKINVLDIADGYVSAAEHEGFGIVFLEAMESGLPIVSTWEGGQTDFLRHERNALLVAPGDIDGIAGNMQRLIGDQGLAEIMGENNKMDVKNYYWPVVVTKFEDVLTSVTNNNVL